MPDSVETWRLYAAEHSVPLGKTINDLDDLQAFYDDVMSSDWWRTNIPYNPTLKVEVAGHHFTNGEGIEQHVSYQEYEPQRYGRATPSKISILPEHLCDMIALHELAHAVQPRFEYVRPRQPDRIPEHRALSAHGPGFAGVFAELVREFGDGAIHDDLRDAYAHFGVPCLSLSEYVAAAESSIAAEADYISMHEETEAYLKELAAERERTGQVLPTPQGRIPTMTWGDWLRFVRGKHYGRFGPGRMTQAQWADMVSPVERCTRKQISLLERAEKMPHEVRLRRIAMCMMVALGMDPIWMRHTLGLVRWDCGIDLDELRVLNPEWVDLVEELNRLGEERPPRWTADSYD
ncbi:hypothetical protein ACIA03_29155 [Nocardioides sp. NPDC051685]|uniref:hypothetical protein n=1 Tax=Nocardioides sp. NPDC051685 TaxID=3364334 RepID=UPI0037A4DEF4